MESSPGPMQYCTSCTIEITHTRPPFNAITTPHTGTTSNAHTSNSKPTHSHSYVIPIKPLQKLFPTHPTSPISLHTSKLNKSPKTKQLSYTHSPKAQHQLNHQKNNPTHPLNLQTKHTHHHTTRIKLQQRTQNPTHS